MTKLYGVVGHPVSHSLSPVIHNAAFEHLEIDAEYLAFDVRPGDIGAFMKILAQEGIWGLSVTMPHKEAIMPFLDKIDDIAQKIGAVNTVYLENNQYIGTNFDWIGIKAPLGDVKGKKVLILGAGGAAQAACYALRDADTTIWNRTHEKAQELAKKWGFKATKDPIEADIIINCTSVGFDNPEKSPVTDPKIFKKTKIAYDLVYGPEETRFIHDAKEANVPKIISGEQMLLEQGYAAFEKWTGQEAPKEVMKKVLIGE